MPFEGLAASLPLVVTNIASPYNADPSLAALYAQLRDWSIQTVQGSSHVPLDTEYRVGRTRHTTPSLIFAV